MKHYIFLIDLSEFLCSFFWLCLLPPSVKPSNNANNFLWNAEDKVGDICMDDTEFLWKKSAFEIFFAILMSDI